MMRVCVLGNSHIAALKLGWPKLEQEQERFQLSFFGVRQPNIRDLRLEGRSIVPNSEEAAAQFAFTSGGKQTINLDDYDSFLLVGLGLSARAAAKSYRRHRLAEHVRAGELLISPACLEAAYYDRISASGAVTWAARIRSVTARPVAIAPHPIPGEGILHSPERTGIWENPDVCRLLFDVYMHAIAKVARELGVTILAPPQDTLRGWLTKDEYSVGSISLTEEMNLPHREGEYGHMNAAYGAIVLGEVLPVLALNAVRRDTLHG